MTEIVRNQLINIIILILSREVLLEVAIIKLSRRSINRSINSRNLLNRRLVTAKKKHQVKYR